MKLMEFISYMKPDRNIIECGLQNGGGYLCKLAEICLKKTKGKSPDASRYEFLKSIEKAKADWLFSNQLLAETTDPDLIDYVVYLVKSNEAKYRYLIKMARSQRITGELWREQKINDM